MLYLNYANLDYQICIETGRYKDTENIAVLMFNDNGEELEWLGCATVYTDGVLEKNNAFIDTKKYGQSFRKWIEIHELGAPTGKYMMKDDWLYPEYHFNLDEIAKHSIA